MRGASVQNAFLCENTIITITSNNDRVLSVCLSNKVVDSYSRDGTIKRRRECLKCGNRFNTTENQDL